jgi:YHS domain-containing protein
MKLRAKIFVIALCSLPVMASVPSAHAEAPIYTGVFSDTALQGYDPVAYFEEGEPVKGDDAFTADYMGAKFKFASSANRDAFIGSPQAYTPQYGGYCAWAMADGKHAKGDARYWKIVDGKLYLNYNQSIQKKWDADIPGFVERADIAWASINE